MPSPNICAYKKFITIVLNNKINYTTVTLTKKKKLIANFAWKTIKLLHY